MTTKGRIFVTGAAGYVGTAFTKHAISEGYTVQGLSRSEKSDEKLRALGAVPVRGDLTTLDVIRKESSEADIIISLASAFDPMVMTYDEAMPTDNGAIDAMVEGIEGTNKPLVMTSGTLLVEPDPEGRVTDESQPYDVNTISTRYKNEQHALAYANSKKIRVMAMRIAAYVYGHGASGVGLIMGMSHQAGSVTGVAPGTNHITTVHVEDAARLYLLAAEKGKAGDIFNASSDTDITADQLLGAIAKAIDVPFNVIPFDEAKKTLGEFFAWFIRAENRASWEKAKRDLGWEPRRPGVLEDIEKGSYQAVANSLKAGGS